MKEKMKKVSEVCKMIFGYGIMIMLFAGGMTFFGYVAALVIGGDTAAVICEWIYKKVIPVIVYSTSCLVLFGLVSMYLGGEMALTTSSGNKYKKR